MEYKWVGAILIIASCSGYGFAIAAGKRREERLLFQLMEILQFMEKELQYRLTALPDLCRMAAGEARGPLHVVFMNLYRELNWQKLPDAESCMYAAIQKSGEMPTKVRRLLIHLGHSLGRFDLPGQIQGIQSIQKRCETSLQSILQSRDERLRSYQTLGICAGVALAIILI